MVDVGALLLRGINVVKTKLNFCDRNAEQCLMVLVFHQRPLVLDHHVEDSVSCLVITAAVAPPQEKNLSTTTRRTYSCNIGVSRLPYHARATAVLLYYRRPPVPSRSLLLTDDGILHTEGTLGLADLSSNLLSHKQPDLCDAKRSS